MRYRIIGENDYSDKASIQRQIFKNREIKRPDEFINIDDHVRPFPTSMVNLRRAVVETKLHVQQKSRIGILFDVDMDGYASGAMLYSYLKRYLHCDDIIIHTNTKKIHGLTKDSAQFFIDNECKLVFTPDAGSSDWELHGVLKEHGITTIVLDHHEVEFNDKVGSNGILVNNKQISEHDIVYRELSGAGVTYLFLLGLDKVFQISYADKFLDLCALGNVADSMDMRDIEVQSLVQDGIQVIENPMLQQLMNVRYEATVNLNPSSIGFYVAPLANALIRMGSDEDKIKMMEAFCGIGCDRYFPYTFKRGKSKDETVNENIYEHVARLCVSYKGKQDRQKKKAYELVERQINIQCHKNVLMIDTTEILDDSALKGLLANHIMGNKGKPTLVFEKIYTDNETGESIYGGSGRGELYNLKTVVQGIKGFIMAEGHQQAFGFKFKTNDLNAFIDSVHEEFRQYKLDKEYPVDFAIEYDDVSEDLVCELCSLNRFYGQGFEEPTVVIINAKIPTSSFKLSSKGTTIVAHDLEKNIKFVWFKTSWDKYNNIVDWNDYVCMNIICKASVSTYEGEVQYQFIVDDEEVIEIEKTEIKEPDTDDFDW